MLKKPTEEIMTFVKLMDAEKAWAYFQLANRSINLPYHNQTHVLFMLKDLLSYFQQNQCCDGHLIQNLMHAIIFHDFNHSGGKLNDFANVTMARGAFENYNRMCSKLGYKVPSHVEVDRLIAATQYPYTPIAAFVEGMDIIRELDLMTVTHFNYIEDEFFAMEQMIGLWRESFSSMGWIEFTEKNVEFLTKIEWKTDFAISQAEGIRNAIEAYRSQAFQMVSEIEKQYGGKK